MVRCWWYPYVEEESKMHDDLQPVLEAIDRQHAAEPVLTRRKLVAGAAGAVGGMGLLGAISPAAVFAASNNTPQTILNVAATAEVLATIVNTVGYQRHLGGDAVTQLNIAAAAREELIHYNVLTSVGAKALTHTIWVPDAVFANRTNFLNTLQVGDQIFVNAYLIGTWAFGNAGNGALAVTAAEFMGVEAVHRALARQSLGLLGNDRVFMKFDQTETAPGAPNKGQAGFEDILGAVAQLKAAGFGFGVQGATPGEFYDFFEVMEDTPNPPGLDTFTPDAS
jgi:hypothetical protein